MSCAVSVGRHPQPRNNSRGRHSRQVTGMKQQILVDSQITSISDDGRLSPDVPGPVSPILLLPYELLAEILVLAVVTPVAIVNDVLSLSQICSYMRQVALSTPQLWAQQIFPITFGVDPGISVIATELFLERSAPLPISVVVDMGRNVLVLPANVISAARRWESIEIYSSLGNEAAIQSEPLVLAQIPAGRLDSLKKVVLLSYNKEIWQNSVTVFQSAPQLVDLFLGVPDGLPAITCMSWPRLTHLSVAFDMPQISVAVGVSSI
ncbi:hypothetical protein B0H11DRAFT_39493 [Mycena galericulata]|nr:hypothetical protein B0H11DRAFT_39493 [Mycena galericulata]